MDVRLTRDDLQSVYARVYYTRAKWYDFGLALGLKDDDLFSIQSYDTHDDARLRSMLSRRLQSGGSLTWRDLCTALRGCTVGRNDVAEEIEKWKGDSRQSCPNQVHIPTPPRSAHHPVLDLTDGTVEQDVLKEDVRELRKRYGNLHWTLRKNLQVIPDIKHYLGDYLDETAGLELSFNELYTKIRSCCTLLDVDILKKIADDVVIDGNQKKEVDQAFNDYTECLKVVIKRRIFTFQGGLQLAEVNEGKSELTIRISVDYLKADIATLKRMKELVRRIFNIPSHAHLKLVRVTPGSMEVTFAISKKTGDELFHGSTSLSLEQMRELAANKVSMATYNSRMVYCVCKLSIPLSEFGDLETDWSKSPVDERIIAMHHPQCPDMKTCRTVSCIKCGENVPQCGYEHHETFTCLTCIPELIQESQDEKPEQATVDCLQAEKQEQVCGTESLSDELRYLPLEETVQGHSKMQMRVPSSISFTWSKEDVPDGISIVFNQAVALDGKLYISGYSLSQKTDIVRKYVYASEHDYWEELPPPPVAYFTLTTLNGQLLILGGTNRFTFEPTKTIFTFDEHSQQWVQFYPAMLIALTDPAIISYRDYLIVMGGYEDESKIVTDVNILNWASSNWITAKSLPNKDTFYTVLIEDNMYLVGQHSKRVLRAHVPTFKSQARSGTWEALPDIPFYHSTPVAVDNILLTVGGIENRSNDNPKPTSSIHMYNPTMNQWTKVGDLPEAMSSLSSICTILSEKLFAVLDDCVYVAELDVSYT